MTTHSEVRNLPYTAKQMYMLVSDINSYAEFLPWCSAARIKHRTVQEGHEVLEADLVVSFKVFREKFRSRVTLKDRAQTIETVYIDGPFKHMVSEWSFEDMEEGCRVKFYVEFEFKNAIMQKLIGMVFNEAMQRIVRAFEKRANILYGT